MKNVAVMDIGTSKIGVLVGRRGINNSLIVASSAEIAYAGYYEGEFVEKDNLQEVMARAISNAEITAKEGISKIFVGVPADFSTCKNTIVVENYGIKQKITNEHIFQIYQKANELKESKEYILISCSPISFVLDDGRKTLNPVGEKTSKITASISYVYAEISFISQINTNLRSIGISEVEYISTPLCVGLYSIPLHLKEQNCLIIDSGFIATSVSIIRGEGLVMLNSFSVGGGQITSDLCECLNISYNQAENLKKQVVLSLIPSYNDEYEINQGNNAFTVSQEKANSIVCARLDMICSLINKCLAYNKEQNSNDMQYFLTGGGISYIKGAKDYLGKSFSKNVMLLVPPDIELNKPHYTSILGLLDFAIKQQEKTQKKLFGFFLKK